MFLCRPRDDVSTITGNQKAAKAASTHNQWQQSNHNRRIFIYKGAEVSNNTDNSLEELKKKTHTQQISNQIEENGNIYACDRSYGSSIFCFWKINE